MSAPLQPYLVGIGSPSLKAVLVKWRVVVEPGGMVASFVVICLLLPVPPQLRARKAVTRTKTFFLSKVYVRYVVVNFTKF